MVLGWIVVWTDLTWVGWSRLVAWTGQGRGCRVGGDEKARGGRSSGGEWRGRERSGPSRGIDAERVDSNRVVVLVGCDQARYVETVRAGPKRV